MTALPTTKVKRINPQYLRAGYRLHFSQAALMVGLPPEGSPNRHPQLFRRTRKMLGKLQKPPEPFSSNAKTHFGTAFFSCYAALGGGDLVSSAATGFGVGTLWGIGYAGFKVIDDLREGKVSGRDALWEFAVVSSASFLNVGLSTMSSLSIHHALLGSALEHALPGSATAIAFISGSLLGTATGMAIESGVYRMRKTP
jgi:hypothetical protein